MPNLTHGERYDRLDQILRDLAKGQKLCQKAVAAFARDNKERARQAKERSRPIDDRIDDLLRAIAKLKRRKH